MNQGQAMSTQHTPETRAERTRHWLQQGVLPVVVIGLILLQVLLTLIPWHTMGLQSQVPV